MQNCCNSTYNSLAPRKIFEHINELWCRTIVSQKCNGNPRTDNNNRQISHVMRKPMFYIRETSAQISFTLTRKLISTFIFIIVIVIFNIVIVPFLYSLNQHQSHLANNADPDQMMLSMQHLFWFCNICLGTFSLPHIY